MLPGGEAGHGVVCPALNGQARSSSGWHGPKDGPHATSAPRSGHPQLGQEPLPGFGSSQAGLKGSKSHGSPHQQGKPHGWGAWFTTVQQEMSVHLSGGCEPVGAASSSSSGGGDAGVAALLPDEGLGSA